MFAVGGHAPTTATPTGKFCGKLCARSVSDECAVCRKILSKGISKGEIAALGNCRARLSAPLQRVEFLDTLKGCAGKLAQPLFQFSVCTIHPAGRGVAVGLHHAQILPAISAHKSSCGRSAGRASAHPAPASRGRRFAAAPRPGRGRGKAAPQTARRRWGAGPCGGGRRFRSRRSPRRCAHRPAPDTSAAQRPGCAALRPCSGCIPPGGRPIPAETSQPPASHHSGWPRRGKISIWDKRSSFPAGRPKIGPLWFFRFYSA